MTEKQVASSLLTALSGNALLTPTYWLDPKSGVNYDVVSQAPQHMIDSVAALGIIPLSTPGASGLGGNTPQLLGNVATVRMMSIRR